MIASTSFCLLQTTSEVSLGKAASCLLTFERHQRQADEFVAHTMMFMILSPNDGEQSEAHC